MLFQTNDLSQGMLKEKGARGWFERGDFLIDMLFFYEILIFRKNRQWKRDIVTVSFSDKIKLM